jgi:aminoglycoside phosphotransferase (APT) family kinase protein
VLDEALDASSGAAPGPAVLAHLDLHPGNVLYAGGRAVLIDLDNLRLAPAPLCAAFSVLRFAWGGEGPREAGRLHATLEAWSAAYARGGGAPLGPGLLRWMLRLECEKVLRILARVEGTGAYESFVANAASRHLPNLEALLSAAARVP